ncbi:MAG: phosphoribosylformylglycinamidine synthase I [Candidatus Dadabacteria bacterium]|nr:MAG: phosphoribosylformylglycinamidine synthase I [Candidatus Dadabacteria bacterium]
MASVKVVVFPGTNCDQDIVNVYQYKLGISVERVWHRETEIGHCDLVVLPGGFSYGDYLRCGALAKISPIMKGIKSFAEKGGKVLGICNGFQILCEVGLLPGVLLPNIGRKFLSRDVFIRVESSNTYFTNGLKEGEVIKVPIAHFEGNYFTDNLESLKEREQIVFTYCTSDGEVNVDDRLFNPNGSLGAVAGVCNAEGNVLGMMPHPERPLEGLYWSNSALKLFAL